MLNLSFKPFSSNGDIYKNMLPQISKEIHGNFNLKYKRRTTPNQQSTRNTPIE